MAAVISECGTYRYLLERVLKTEHKGDVVFIMLNPSTADANINDPTIRKCMYFTARLLSRRLLVANLYALRSTDPKKLWKHSDPIGPDNDKWLSTLLNDQPQVICAWGNHGKPERVKMFCTMAEKAGVRLWCLGTNKNGSPKHPLYLAKGTPLIPFELTTGHAQ